LPSLGAKRLQLQLKLSNLLVQGQQLISSLWPCCKARRIWASVNSFETTL
jgi:hypothetical protein